MGIDPKIEKPTRTMLGHAIRGELEELASQIHAVGDDVYRQALALCLATAAYIAVDVSGRWPTDADIREVARSAMEPTTDFQLSEADVYDYLSRSALGTERLDDVFSSLATAGSLPLLIAARLLVSFRPRGKDWWEYLDQVEAALETADAIDLSVLPALTLRARRPSATSNG
jgi:hypothetical protein